MPVEIMRHEKTTLNVTTAEEYTQANRAVIGTQPPFLPQPT
mgnify:FL=1